MFPVSVKGVLATPSNEVVLLMNERNEWELPGGRVELGESSTECLAREIWEELNLDVSVGAPLDSYLFEFLPGRHVYIVTYICELEGAYRPVISDEHKRLGAFPPDALPERLPAGYRASIAAWFRGRASAGCL